MLAEVETATHRQLCAWHHVVLTAPEHEADYDEFERWILKLLERKSCSFWTHYPVRWLWQAVRGEEPEPRSPAPCAQLGCRERPVVVPPNFDPKAAAQAVARLLLGFGQVQKVAGKVMILPAPAALEVDPETW
jgi:hypothetical protein